MTEQMDLRKKISEQLKTPSKHAALRAAMAANLMIGFWFSNGVILAVGLVDTLNHCIRALTSGK